MWETQGWLNAMASLEIYLTFLSNVLLAFYAIHLLYQRCLTLVTWVFCCVCCLVFVPFEIIDLCVTSVTWLFDIWFLCCVTWSLCHLAFVHDTCYLACIPFEIFGLCVICYSYIMLFDILAGGWRQLAFV